MEKQGYRFEKVVFRIAIGIMALFFVMLVMLYGFESYFYVSCPKNAPVDCVNPVVQCSNVDPLTINIECQAYSPLVERCQTYPNNPLCTTPTIPPGSYVGDFPPFFVRSSVLIFFGVMVSAFLVNHLLFNRRRK
jgi:hypothetical protein